MIDTDDMKFVKIPVNGEYKTFLAESLGDLILSQEKYLDQLQADLLEAYKAIVEECDIYQDPMLIHTKCLYCSEYDNKHSNECIVNKANKYIEGIK